MRMNWSLWAGVALGVSMAGLSWAEDARTPESAVPAPAVKRQTTCPVMGGKTDPKLFVDVEGKRVYVCCRGCMAPILKDPAKYIAKLEKEGVTPDKAPAPEPAAKTGGAGGGTAGSPVK